jgi:hypothetical protein
VANEQSKKGKSTNLGKFACQNTELIQEVIGEFLENYLKDQFFFRAQWMQEHFGGGMMNEFYPLTEKYVGLTELCTGMQMRNPHFWFDENRLVITAEINQNPHRTMGHCESDSYIYNTDPRFYYDILPENKQEAIVKLQQMTNFQNQILN